MNKPAEKAHHQEPTAAAATIPAQCRLSVTYQKRPHIAAYMMLVDTARPDESKILISDNERRPLWVNLSDCLID